MSTNTKLTQYHYKQQTMWTGSRKYCELNIWFIISDICINLHFNEMKVENTQINFFSNIIKIMKIGKYYVEQFWWTDSLHEKYPNTDVHWSVFPHIQSYYWKITTRKSLYLDTSQRDCFINLKACIFSKIISVFF